MGGAEVGPPPPQPSEALRPIGAQDGDLGQFGTGAAATDAVGAAPAQDFLPLILKHNKKATVIKTSDLPSTSSNWTMNQQPQQRNPYKQLSWRSHFP